MTSLLSFYQYRRKLRLELFTIRQSGRDCSEIRLTQDAKLLDAMLIEAGYELPYQTRWGKKRGERAFEYRARKHLQQSITNYSSVAV